MLWISRKFVENQGNCQKCQDWSFLAQYMKVATDFAPARVCNILSNPVTTSLKGSPESMNARHYLFAMLSLLLAGSIGSSILAQTKESGSTATKQSAAPQTKASSQPASVAPGTEKQPIDLTNIPLKEGTQELFSDKRTGCRISRTVKDGRVTEYIAVNKEGRRLPLKSIIMPHAREMGEPACGFCYESGGMLFCLSVPCKSVNVVF
jgi:hypothetical protein